MKTFTYYCYPKLYEIHLVPVGIKL